MQMTTADDWFKGLPSIKFLAAICIGTEIAGFVLRGLLGPRWTVTIMAAVAVPFLAVAVGQHRRRRRQWEVTSSTSRWEGAIRWRMIRIVWAYQGLLTTTTGHGAWRTT